MEIKRSGWANGSEKDCWDALIQRNSEDLKIMVAAVVQIFCMAVERVERNEHVVLVIQESLKHGFLGSGSS